MHNNIKEDKTKDEEYLLPCLNCDNKTYHVVLKSVHLDGQDGEISYAEEYEIVQCCGCRQVSFRKNSTCSEDVIADQETGELLPVDNIELYPSRIVGRKEIREMLLLPMVVAEIYRETRNAVCNKSSVLAGLGIRKIVEVICMDKNMKGTLQNMIDDLVTSGILAKGDAELLHKMRSMGNKVAHGLDLPKEEELDIAMDIVENLMRSVYILPKKSEKIFLKFGTGTRLGWYFLVFLPDVCHPVVHFWQFASGQLKRRKFSFPNEF